jgi:outer membrane biosynthesis protein TonB
MKDAVDTVPNIPAADSSGMIDMQLLAAMGHRIEPVARISREDLFTTSLPLAARPLAPAFVAPERTESGLKPLLIALLVVSLAALGTSVAALASLRWRDLAPAPQTARVDTTPREVTPPVVEPPSTSPTVEPVPSEEPAEQAPVRSEPPRPTPAIVAPPTMTSPTMTTTAREPDRSLDGLIDAASGAEVTELEGMRGTSSTAPSLPEMPSRDSVLRALRSASDEVAACAPGDVGTATVRVVIEGATGRVRSANVTGDLAGTEAGSCVARTVRSVQFERFSRERFEVSFPYRV